MTGFAPTSRQELMKLERKQTVRETAAALRLGETTVRSLVEAGLLARAKGISEIRIRQSVVDAYGKPSSK